MKTRRFIPCTHAIARLAGSQTQCFLAHLALALAAVWIGATPGPARAQTAQTTTATTQTRAVTTIQMNADFAAIPAAAFDFALLEPTTQYQHGVFGEDFEFAALATGDGSILYRPNGKVLEDRLIRVFDLDHNDQPEILLIEANAAVGANLVLIDLSWTPATKTWRVESIARGPSVGQGFRWMNPLAGQLDLESVGQKESNRRVDDDGDGDGVDELAAMITPHIGGPVVIYAWRDGALVPVQRVEVPSLASNHRFGDAQLDWSELMRDTQGNIVIAMRNRQDWSKPVIIAVPKQ